VIVPGLLQTSEYAAVARYKIPEHLLTVAELPLTKVGKIDKKALREIGPRRRSRGRPASLRPRPAPAGRAGT
jgi:non-ribosomal peptide synthetase component E (peptide arylation enzyme)